MRVNMTKTSRNLSYSYYPQQEKQAFQFKYSFSSTAFFQNIRLGTLNTLVISTHYYFKMTLKGVE